jgi:hypothetical protein
MCASDVQVWLAGRCGLAGDLGGDYFGDAVGPGRQGHAPFAEGDADLACDRIGWRRF